MRPPYLVICTLLGALFSYAVFFAQAYRHHSQTGQWPDAITANQFCPIPPGWDYFEHVSLPADPPMLLLHGEYHNMLAYYFMPPNNSPINRRWTVDWEGSDRDFEADQAYAIRNP